MKFSFLLPLDRREHGIDVRDAGLAVVNTIEAETDGKIFDIGGDESWRKTGRELLSALFKARGLSPLPDSAYRNPDPTVDKSWYFEDWIDTSISEEVLQYQKHSFGDYINTLRKNVGWQRYLLAVISPLVTKKLLKDSPYYGKSPQIDSRTFWETICETFEIDQTTLEAVP